MPWSQDSQMSTPFYPLDSLYGYSWESKGYPPPQFHPPQFGNVRPIKKGWTGSFSPHFMPTTTWDPTNLWDTLASLEWWLRRWCQGGEVGRGGNWKLWHWLKAWRIFVSHFHTFTKHFEGENCTSRWFIFEFLFDFDIQVCQNSKHTAHPNRIRSQWWIAPCRYFWTMGDTIDSTQQWTWVWANYNDVSRGHPKWWFNKGTSPKSP